ncbi:hypothetical protein EGT74_27000 [Chitinophaga lutea]|uniref:histidine kinase n=1 Tax=Chitinophaga lutea TaxID=2488634 RepID=A0A3N4PQK0_9BACT|nr:histidine kinase [Chitinophaga lutea]RPE06000.1 hypothetical protein EGT74_27000 [Chitinophaga lutea]
MKLSRLVCFLCCLPVLLTAGDGYRFRYIDLPEIMRDATINTTAVDRAGMLWFSSGNGLHRYDGNQLLTFHQVSKPAIGSNFINVLFADSKDRLWIGANNGVTCFDLRSWKTAVVPLANGGTANITRICESRDGGIYLASNEGRFFRYGNNRLELLADLGKAFPFNPTRAAVNFLQETEPGVFWVHSDHKLLRIDSKGQVYDPGLGFDVSGPVYFYGPQQVIFQDPAKNMVEYNLRTRERKKLPVPFNDTANLNKRMLLFPMPGGEIGIFINKRGLFSYNPFTRESGERMKGVDVNFSTLRAGDIQTAGNKIYICFSKNIAELQRVQTPFTSLLINPVSESAPNSVRSMLRHPNGLLYTGTYSNGFISFDETTGEKKILGPHFVYASLLWDNNRILLATEGLGLQWYYVKENRFEAIRGDTLHTPREDRMRDLFLISLCRESDSLVWVGGYNGVFRMNPFTGATAYIRDVSGWEELRRAKVYHILRVDQQLYFSTGNGLYAYHPGKKQLRRLIEEPLYVTQHVGKELWAATNGKGILVLDENGRLKTTLNTQSGLAGNSVYCLVQYGQKAVAGTNQGLSIVDITNRTAKNFTRLQNLPSNEFNHSAAHVSGGRVYLGTINGLTTFTMADLAAFTQRDHPVPMHLTSFSTVSRSGPQHDYSLPYHTEDRLVVPAGVQYFSLRFGGVDAAADQVYYYRTREKAPWLEIGRQRELSFAGMAPGKYMVQLAAKLNSGNDFTTLLTVPLVVRPNWYETVWFKVAVILALLLGAWLLFRYRMQQLLREQRLRTKIAGDLHDEVGSSLTRIYFQADHLSMRHSDKTALRKIADSSKHALSTMSDMVWSIDARFDTAEDLVARMRDYLSNLQNDLDIKCTFELQGEYAGRRLSQAVRQNFFLIFKEAISNAARYSSEPCLKVELAFDKSVRMRVTNGCLGENGKMKHYQGGRGIEQMQARAARMKGSLTARREGEQFVLHLQVPA